MIVQCPDCSAKFNLPDGKIGPKGAKLRCGKCKHLFHFVPPASEAPPVAPEAVAPESAAPETAAQPKPEPAPQPEPETPQAPPESAAPESAAPGSAAPGSAAPEAAAPEAAPAAAEEEEEFEPPAEFDYPDLDELDAAGPLTDFGAEAPAAQEPAVQKPVAQEPAAAPKLEPAPEPAPASKPEPGQDADAGEDVFPGGDALFDDADADADAGVADDGTVKPGFSLDDVADLDAVAKKPLSGKKRRIILLSAILLVILLLTGGALWFLDLLPGGAEKPVEELAPTEEPAAEQAPPEEPAVEPEKQEQAPERPKENAKVKNIVLQNVRQYFVTNEKAGQLCVIEGKAVNKFKEPKEMIRLQANLFDDKGAVIASEKLLCGNTVSLFQLQVMTKQELKEALGSQVGVLTNNTNLPPDGDTPFMFVFFDVPDSLAEFVVKVVDAKDPPGK